MFKKMSNLLVVMNNLRKDGISKNFRKTNEEKKW